MPGERRRIVSSNQRHAHPGTKGPSTAPSSVKRTVSETSQRSQRNYSITSQKPKNMDKTKPTHVGHGRAKTQPPPETKKVEESVPVHEQNGNSNSEPEVEVEMDDNTDRAKEESSSDLENNKSETVQQKEDDDKKSESDEKWAEKAPEEYNIKSFNDKILEYSEVFETDKFDNVNEDFPVEDLISFVNVISGTIDEFKQQSQDSQKQLEELCSKMKHVKQNIHFSITKRQMELSPEEEIQSIEQRELTEKLAKLNAEVARANAELSEAIRLSVETERTATAAQVYAQKAKDEAQQIEEEIELKRNHEAKKKVEETRKMEEAIQKQEEEERMIEQAKQDKEAEWKRKESGFVEKSAVWEKWPTFEIVLENGDVGCVVRASPGHFSPDHVELEPVSQLNCNLTYGPQEELVSSILRFSSTVEDGKLDVPVYICVPFTLSRTSAHSREPFIKAEINGRWSDLETREVTFDHHKEAKFAQAELKTFAKFAVMTRLKRDYITFSKRSAKIASSYDQRVTLTVPKETFKSREHVLLQVQPVDSTTIHELQQKKPECKHILTSSPIIKISWEGADIVKPITVTIPCPPNPAKARKIAQMRKMKEDKMKQARPVIVTYDEEQEKKRLLEEKKKKYQQQQEEAMNELEEKKFVQTKWYMGDYAHTDDDETDLLYLLTQSSNGKWSVLENIHIHQIKLDLLQFDMTKPLDSFMVLRTRMNTPDDTVALMANIISEFLSQRFAQVLVKQRSDDPYDTLISVVPANKAVKTSKEMAAKGYIEGPDPSPVINLNEGDHIEIAFRGNICDTTNRPPLFVYNSNIISELEVYLSEVDKYLQKNFRVYRGKIQIYRCYCDVKEKKAKRQMSVADDIGQTAITEKIKQHLCDIPINIPKYNLESSPVPVKAPVTIVNDSDPINENLMRYLAVEMGEEWRRLAQILNVSRARMQAILRNIQISDGTEEDARYEMLMSWLKKMPKAVDKVSTLNGALMRCGRDDLTEEIQKRNKEFRMQHIH
ncbi:death domain-containing protein 1-like [Mytilus trossulus]|uniref:death domain-containing protein 1-like n=1 Tax=Mytilus trossulus TaxID=6551 RepID=UPI00300557D2